MGSKQLCRLCLQTSDDVVNVWETFLDSTIASILAKHFWFQVHKNDGFAEFICVICWIKTKEFHEFYRQVEQSQKCVSISDGESEPDLNVIKYEEIDDRSQIITVSEDDDEYEDVEMEPLQISSSENEDYDSESSRSADDKNHQYTNNEQEFLPTKVKKYRHVSLIEKVELESHIHEFFNMNCEMCNDVKFETLLEAKQHYSNDHETAGYLLCCNKKFHKRAEVVHHLRYHINIMKHGTSEQIEQLKLESQLHEFFNMNCEMCSDVKFRTLLEAQRHYRKDHGTAGYILCCNKKFHKRADVVQHLRHHIHGMEQEQIEQLELESQLHEFFNMNCEMCNDVKFETLVEAKQHYRNDHETAGYLLCCNKKFQKRAEVVHHLRYHINIMQHGTSEQIEQLKLESQLHEFFNMNCEMCSDVKFRTLLEAKRHYRKDHGTAGYLLCCNKKFLKRADVVQHLRHHVHVMEQGPSKQMEQEAQIREYFGMKCEICYESVEFETLLDVRQHYRQVHKTRGYLICCDKKFYRRIKMMDHICRHTGSYACTCDLCGKQFWNKHALKSHMNTHIPHDSRPFECELCKKKFVEKVKLDKHIEYKHSTNEGKEFSCEKCDKTLSTKLQLYHHTRQVHKLIADKVCEVCARIFKGKKSLDLHIEREHSQTPPPKVQCEICGIWLKSLYAHRKTHKAPEPVNCPICNKVVQHKHQLNEHIRYAHSDKRHPCQLCDKVFKGAKNLKEHLAVHTGQDLYECQYCEKKFKSNANMYSHRKRAHLAEWTRDFGQRNQVPDEKTATNDKKEAEIN